MHFSLLGPLEVTDGARTIVLGAPKQRALLALLLLRRGQATSVETLAEELWAGEPPATATKAVRVYVGQLRKSLGAEVIVTRGGRYVVPLDDHETDVERFEQLTAEARRRLEQGDAKQAAAMLREALGLWRGEPLADFIYDEFARNEIVRLEEARLAALETRIEADLASGRDDELVPELQGLVDAHPLRERLRGDLMLALYRAGRQAEALDAYRDGRRRLVDELGIEPGPALQELERAILSHDESIGVPRPRAAPRSRRRPAILVAAGGLLILVAAASVAAISLTRTGGGGISSVDAGNSLVAIDPDSGRVVASVPAGATPTAVAVGGGAAWVLNADDQTITRVDAQTKQARTLGIGATPTDLTATDRGVWVGNGGRLARAQFAGVTAVALTRLDPRTGAALAKVSLPLRGSSRSNVARDHIAAAAGSVWTIAPDYSLVRINARRARVSAVVRGVGAVAVAAGPDAVWAMSEARKLVRVSPRTNRVTARFSVPAIDLSALAVGAGSVWATDPYQGTLWRVDPGAQVVQRTIDVGVGADTVAFGDGAVWVANSLQGTVSRVDPQTNRVARTIRLGGAPRAVAIGEGLVWVAVAEARTTALARREAGQKVRSLPAPTCGTLITGSRPADLIVVSDLPLRGGPRFATPQMSAAILRVLRAHSFRAGRYALGYQSCDDSTAQTGLFDERKCAANARAYAADADVIGIVGPYNSGCAYAQVAIASRAGLPIVSPTNSDPGLTRAAFGAPRDALKALYPAGRRTYVRLMTTDDAQAAAGALLARRLHARRIFTVDDGGYGAALSAYFARATDPLGLRVVGRARWDADGRGRSELVDRVRRAQPQAVYLCGLVDTGAGGVLAALRRALPASLPIIGCDGLLPISLLFQEAGPAARGTYVTMDGLVTERLGRAGRSFVRGLAASQLTRVDVTAVYAAQATEVLLQAIARSNGTRDSVAAQLFRTRVHGGLLGDFSLDAAGDADPAPVTVVRAEHGGGSAVVGSYDGARLVAVLKPRG